MMMMIENKFVKIHIYSEVTLIDHIGSKIIDILKYGIISLIIKQG